MIRCALVTMILAAAVFMGTCHLNGHGVPAQETGKAKQQSDLFSRDLENDENVAAEIRILTNNKVVSLSSTHFDHKSQAARERAAKVLAGIVKKEPGSRTCRWRF